MFRISGKVLAGQKYGRVLGFPTVNLDRRQYVRQKMRIRLGVWAGIAELTATDNGLRIYKAAIVIGPLEKNNLPKIEAHIINFKGDLYGKTITIVLNKFLRPFKKYRDVEQLKQQISRDIKKVKKY